MASLLQNKTINGLCRVRITPRNNDCTFEAGANSYTFDSPLELSITPETSSVAEIDKKRLNGVSCFYRPELSYVKSLTVAGKMCDFCPDAFAEFFAWNTYVNGPDNVGVGMPLNSNKTDSCSPTGIDKFAIEIFAPVATTGGICAGIDSAFVRITLPVLINVLPSEFTFSPDDTLDFGFTATALGDNGTYLNGPFNDFGGVSGPINVILNDGMIIEALPTGYVLPAASCDPVPVPAQ